MQLALEDHLSKEEFLTLLLIYAAHVDYEYSEKEVEFIHKNSTPEVYDKMYSLFQNTSDYACMKILLQHKHAYLSCKEEEDAIFKLMKDLFEVDGEYSRIEKNFVPFFKRMIQL